MLSSSAIAGDLAAALDPVVFAHTRLNFTPDEWQGELLRSTAKQVVLNCSRQSGKSTTIAALAEFTATYEPGALVLLLSPTQRQSGELFKKTVDFHTGQDSPIPLETETKLTLEMSNGSRIISLPGRPDTIRGYSAPRLIVIDEAAFADDELYEAVRPMLIVSGGRIVLMSTPMGKRGFFHDVWMNGGHDWQRFEVPATKCPRITPAALATEQRSMPSWKFNQEYLCSFEDNETSAFSYEDVQAALLGEHVEAWTL